MATQWFYVDMAQDVTEGKMLPFYFPSSVELSDSIGGKAQMAASVAFMPHQLPFITKRHRALERQLGLIHYIYCIRCMYFYDCLLFMASDIDSALT